MKLFSLLLMITGILSGCSKEPPKNQADTPAVQPKVEAVVPVFSGKSAMSFLTAQTDFGPRNPGSPGHQQCLTYLQFEMQKYTSAVNTQPFTMAGYNGEILNLTNIISSFNLQATKRVLFIAHWDTRPRADNEKDPKKRNTPILGANDAASGVAVFLEMARQFKTNPPPIGVDILFVDGEDYGKEGDTEKYLLGAKYFADHMPQGFNPMFGILLDMIGDKELELKKEQYSLKYAPDIVDLVWSTANALNLPQFSDEPQQWVMDDHLPFNEKGIKTIDLIDFAYPDTSNRYWHTLEDTPDKCSVESLEAVGTVLMHVIYKQTP
ncbi:MAG: M28 family peptidase [Bacteroidota bacterium]